MVEEIHRVLSVMVDNVSALQERDGTPVLGEDGFSSDLDISRHCCLYHLRYVSSAQQSQLSALLPPSSLIVGLEHFLTNQIRKHESPLLSLHLPTPALHHHDVQGPHSSDHSVYERATCKQLVSGAVNSWSSL